MTSLHADVQKTVQAGARVLTGGKPADRSGNFYLPTVLTDIPENSPAYREELFGPVASLFRVKNVDDAIRLANDNRYGLGASAWTNDSVEQERFINELEAGMVFINQLVASDPQGSLRRGEEIRTWPGIERAWNPRVHEHQDGLGEVGGDPVD